MPDDKRVLTCVYCGHEYPEGTPSWGNDLLTEHIKVCTKHPMRAAEQKIVKLKKALLMLTGAKDKSELVSIRAAMPYAPTHLSPAEKAQVVEAIDIIIAEFD